MISLKCIWCKEIFEFQVQKGKYGRGIIICPHCTRINPSSIKELIENPVNKKHIHKEYK